MEESIGYIDSITSIYADLNKAKFDKQKYEELSEKNRISTKLFIKLMHSYITEKHRQHIQMFVKQYIDTLNKLKDFGNHILQQNLNEYNPQVYNYILNYIDNFRTINSLLLDYYFIRRFIDKDYIKKGILYCGFEHSINIIIFLGMYFNMEIVNASYKNDSTRNGAELTYALINITIRDLTMNYMDKREFIKKSLIKNYDAGQDKWIQCSTDIL